MQEGSPKLNHSVRIIEKQCLRYLDFLIICNKKKASVRALHRHRQGWYINKLLVASIVYEKLLSSLIKGTLICS